MGRMPNLSEGSFPSSVNLRLDSSIKEVVRVLSPSVTAEHLKLLR